MSNNSRFESVENPTVGRSVFDLSYSKKLTCNFGQLIPILCEEVVPGDKITIAHDIVCRLQPMLVPILHEVDIFTHTFEVSYRILWDDWEDWISGGADGDFTATIPTWTPTLYNQGSLWDYLGFPIDVLPTGAEPLDFPRIAYNRIFNEYYRDQNLTAEVAETNETILKRSYAKDYFTSALPWQQRGVAPAIPLAGKVYLEGLGKLNNVWNVGPEEDVYESGGRDATYPAGTYQTIGTSGDLIFAVRESTGSPGYPDMYSDLANAETFNVADMRLSFQIQKWMERNARGGVRYKEFIQNHFNVDIRDERAQRPIYLGGTKMPVIVSEVMQTAPQDTGTPLANLAGKGITADTQFSGSVYVREYGLVMTLMSIMPKGGYQQGINRQWLRKTKYDFFFPEFAHLSEQAITDAEIFITDDNAAENTKIFGYQGQYDEMRVKHDMVCGMMRDTLDYWHLSRKFNNKPVLTQAFLEVNPEATKRIFAVQDEDPFIINVGNIIKAVRPMPAYATPGLIDHF